METIGIECDGRTLRADIRRADGPTAALVVHGWTGSRAGSSSALAVALQEAGVTSLALDLPGHGESEGDELALTRADFLRAALAGFDTMRVLCDDCTRWLAVGTSFGGYFAALVAAERELAALALRVPANYPDAGFDTDTMRAPMHPDRAGERWAWLSAPRDAGDTRALEAVHRFAGPVLLLEAGSDDVIPPRTLANYAAAAAPERARHVVIEGAPHAMSTSPALLAEANDVLVAWLEECVLGR